jgi:hypothetical protein
VVSRAHGDPELVELGREVVRVDVRQRERDDGAALDAGARTEDAEGPGRWWGRAGTAASRS